MDRKIVVIAHNIRSAHNIGALLRTCEGLGIHMVYLTGYSPYPLQGNDARLPHLSLKATEQIRKTALGAEKMQKNVHQDNVLEVIKSLRTQNYRLIGLEQSPGSIPLHEFQPPKKIALLLGEEVKGIDKVLIKKCDTLVEIPMLGKKESYNVVQAAAMTLYHVRFTGI